jgi:hypothetical protein
VLGRIPRKPSVLPSLCEREISIKL